MSDADRIAEQKSTDFEVCPIGTLAKLSVMEMQLHDFQKTMADGAAEQQRMSAKLAAAPTPSVPVEPMKTYRDSYGIEHGAEYALGWNDCRKAFIAVGNFASSYRSPNESPVPAASNAGKLPLRESPEQFGRRVDWYRGATESTLPPVDEVSASWMATYYARALKRVKELERYKKAWIEWRSLQSGDVEKMLDAAIRCEVAERDNARHVRICAEQATEIAELSSNYKKVYEIALAWFNGDSFALNALIKKGPDDE